jgi:hypothetical protein
MIITSFHLTPQKLTMRLPNGLQKTCKIAVINMVLMGNPPENSIFINNLLLFH